MFMAKQKARAKQLELQREENVQPYRVMYVSPTNLNGSLNITFSDIWTQNKMLGFFCFLSW